MALLFTRVSIGTHLSEEQAADVVRELIRPEGFLGVLAYAPNDPRPFIGRSKGNQFKFRRRLPLWWHNSFQPIVVGHVRPLSHGAVFDGSIRLHLFVAVLAPVLLGMIGFQAVIDLHHYIQTSGAAGDYGLFLFVTAFGAFGVLSYRYERREAERILRAAFERKGGTFPDAPAYLP